MDPISLAYFAVIIPVAVAYAAYVIYRFRGKYKAQIKSVKADDVTFDYDIKTERSIPSSDMREKE